MADNVETLNPAGAIHPSCICLKGFPEICPIHSTPPIDNVETGERRLPKIGKAQQLINAIRDANPQPAAPPAEGTPPAKPMYTISIDFDLAAYQGEWTGKEVKMESEHTVIFTSNNLESARIEYERLVANAQPDNLADKIRKAVEGYCEHFEMPPANCLVCGEIVQAVVSTLAPSQPAQQWISLGMELPAKGALVICACKDGTVQSGSYSGKGGWFDMAVTHWMALPDPPKGDR